MGDGHLTVDRFRNDESRCRVVIFSSRKAGSGASRDQLPRLTTMLREASIGVTTAANPEELLTQIQTDDGPQRPGRDVVVVAAGGDGTISLAATLIMSVTNGERVVPIVPMPLGTENLLARHFGYSASAEQVVATIRYGDVTTVDSGVANGRPFLIMATSGFDAEVVRGLHLTRRGHIWRLSYLRPIARAMLRYRFPKIRVSISRETRPSGEGVESAEPADREWEHLECGWSMVFNLPRYGGGLAIEPEADGSDGRLDVVLFRRGSITSGLKYVVGIWTGRHLRFRDVTRRRARRVRIESDERVPFQLDGDYVARLPLEIEIRPASVPLLLPERP